MFHVAKTFYFLTSVECYSFRIGNTESNNKFKRLNFIHSHIQKTNKNIFLSFFRSILHFLLYNNNNIEHWHDIVNGFMWRATTTRVNDCVRKVVNAFKIKLAIIIINDIKMYEYEEYFQKDLKLKNKLGLSKSISGVQYNINIVVFERGRTGIESFKLSFPFFFVEKKHVFY